MSADAEPPRSPESEERIQAAVEQCRAWLADLTFDERTEAVRRIDGWLALEERGWLEAGGPVRRN
jgi:hypothetical protein